MSERERRHFIVWIVVPLSGETEWYTVKGGRIGPDRWIAEKYSSFSFAGAWIHLMKSEMISCLDKVCSEEGRSEKMLKQEKTVNWNDQKKHR